MREDDYAGVAGIYDPLLNPFLNSTRRLVRRALKDHYGNPVLDMGCGTGRQALYLSKAGIRVVGVDRSPAMLAQARKKTPDSVGLVQGDLRELGFKDDAFDAVLFSFVLHEMPVEVREAALREAMRVSKRMVFIVDYRLPSTFLGRVFSSFAHIPERLAGPEHYRQFRDFMRRGALPGLTHNKGLGFVETRPALLGAAELAVFWVMERK